MNPPDWIRENVALAGFTSIGLGGNARYFCEIRDKDVLIDTLAWTRSNDIPLHILGGGSNTIFSDDGYHGLVLKLALGRPDPSPMILNKKESSQTDRVLLSVPSGVNWDHFVLECCKQGLSGIECLSGIPGCVGASPIQNIGAYGQEVSDTITEVVCLDRHTLKECIFSNQECDFGYRRSRFKRADRNSYIILEVRFLLYTDARIRSAYPELQARLKTKGGPVPKASVPERLLDVREVVLGLRRRKSMLLDPNDPHSRSCGSFFMNPVLDEKEFKKFQEVVQRQGLSPSPAFLHSDGSRKIPAAWLIEQSGFPRGHRHKGVGISPKHALALVNYAGTTQELLELKEVITSAVYKKFGILLKPEPILVV